jgi:hypothetical protein
MATVIVRWTNGAANDAWADANNWNPAVPTADDEVIFPAGVGGNPHLNMDQSAIDLDLIHTEDGFRGNIGEPGNPLQVTATKVYHEGSGMLYYEDKSAGVTETPLLLISSRGGGAVLLGETYTNIIARAGKITIDSTVTDAFRLFVTQPSHGRGHQPIVTVENGAGTALNQLHANGGITTLDAQFNTINMTGAADVTVTQAIGNPVSTVMLYGGFLQYDYRLDAVVDVTTVRVFGGILDLTQDARTVVFGDDLQLFPGGTIQAFQDQITFTAIGSPKFYQFGGNLEER